MRIEKALTKTEETVTAVEYLYQQYQDVTAKTDSLHNLSKQLMKQQKVLKDKKASIKERLHCFKLYRTLSNNVNQYSVNVNSDIFMETLNQIDECMNYTQSHPNFKESKAYHIKFENILSQALQFIKKHFDNIIVNTTGQVTDPDTKTNLLTSTKDDATEGESSFSVYYGKNLANWQLGDNPLTELTEEQVDLLYHVKDVVEEYKVNETLTSSMPLINTSHDYIKWMVGVEKQMKEENLREYSSFFNKLQKQSLNCQDVLKKTEETVTAVEYLYQQYQDVTAKTDSLHNLSKQLMKQQKVLKDKKASIKERLHCFKLYRTLSNNVNQYSVNVNSDIFMETLNQIDEFDMERSGTKENLQETSEELHQRKVQKNLANWQLGDNPLTELTEEQVDLLYHVKDVVEDYYYGGKKTEDVVEEYKVNETLTSSMPLINTSHDYIKWMVGVEKQMKEENLREYSSFFNKLQKQSLNCQDVLKKTEETVTAVEYLYQQYQDVTAKTDSLHNLSKQLMKQQKVLKDKKASIKERLHCFKLYRTLSNNVNQYSNQRLITSNLKIFCLKHFSLLKKHFDNIIVNTTGQVTDPDTKTNLLTSTKDDATEGESSFSVYYGKFCTAAIKVRPIIKHVEDKVEKHNNYQQLISVCQQTYFSFRSPVMTDAVIKALIDLKNKHKGDHSILFRSAGLFIMQVCQDESNCFNYFFSNQSVQLDEYFGVLCQNLYDMLRPHLIGIYHLEVLTELCGILRSEMLNDQIQTNETLTRFKEVILQLLEDIEERLVYRTHVFFHNDLRSYQPSPGDLAYPEKLQHMENIAEELENHRKLSMDSEEVARINGDHMSQFRSYTGNSPADLHGMWYPTVKRTLVCLSRLYCCLDREIFQGLAQEALSICVETIAKAEILISARKTPMDGRLFQIKHLLILREQIAPFQVDFTIKEVALDFSNIKAAAIGLINNRHKLFTFSNNNAFLEFLLEGTPTVKEYLIDSRKDIDKQLKAACEAFISNTTTLIISPILEWIRKAENFLQSDNSPEQLLYNQDFAKAVFVAKIITHSRKNIKAKIPKLQQCMQLYLANRETEFILFRPIKINIMNAFMQIENILDQAKYSQEDETIISCPTAEQVNILISSVSLSIEQDSQIDVGTKITLNKPENVQTQKDEYTSDVSTS
ncbi:hypothetical protein FQA39_LY09582 [Lamprigera yunnana]|nr:hypothetical protein FQA39_LY09582 [Lamprigera yunnana]